ASTAVNNVIVFVKLAVIVLIIVFGFMYVRPENWRPFIPTGGSAADGYGWSGVLRAVGIVLPTLIGFDAVSTASQEARSPQRDVPVAILASLSICAALYILVALVVTGLTKYPELNAPHPILVAVTAAGPALHWLAPLIDVAAIASLASVVLVLLLAQPRILFAMSRDGLLPAALSQVHPKFRTPYLATILTGIVASIFAGFFPIELLWDLAIIGALFAFAVVCAGVLALRYRSPNLMRPFRVPFVPVVPILGILFSLAMMATLPRDTWVRLAVWVVIGIGVYFVYGARNSRRLRGAAVSSD
ncbi:MAG TPA: amino acid permease, partial [Gemmatimonadaceae bacterium]|nr:amino acid permease [Gemmatimonadaceae bacterium]